MTLQTGDVRLFIPWPTIFRILCAVALVWVWLQLWPIFMIVLVTLVLAVTLEPIVQWLEDRRLKRGRAVAIVGTVILVAVAAFLVAAWVPLAEQSRLIIERVASYQEALAARMPATFARVMRRGPQDPSQMMSVVVGWASDIGIALLTASASTLFAFILTLYLLADGRRTYEWLMAYVPKAKRARTDETLSGITAAVFAYVVGNLLTSLFAAVFVFASLTLLKVPAALILALLAGVCDFVPILGFFVALAPAVALALTVSPATAVAVVALYGVCHAIENYVIVPKVYGHHLKLSGVAVLLALVVGAELGGIIGAVLALPLVAAYPIVERIWLREYLGREVLAEHARLEQQED